MPGRYAKASPPIPLVKTRATTNGFRFLTQISFNRYRVGSLSVAMTTTVDWSTASSRRAYSQIHDALERGEIELVDRALETFERLAGEHKIPKYLWYADLYRSMRELLAGHFAEAEPRIARAYATGSRVQQDLARLWHVVQMQALRIEQGRAEGFLPELREVEKIYPLEAMQVLVANQLFQKPLGELLLQLFGRLCLGAHQVLLPRHITADAD